MSPWDDEDDQDLLKLWNELQRPKPEVEWTAELLGRPLEQPAEGLGRGFIQDYLHGRVNDASRTVQEREHELYIRQKLHHQNVEQLNYQISRAALALDRFKGWAVGYNRGVDEARIELERTLRDLRKEKRSGRLRFWDDVVRLRDELREKRQEHEAMVRRTRMQSGERRGR